jgi:hypothetical protein
MTRATWLLGLGALLAALAAIVAACAGGVSTPSATANLLAGRMPSSSNRVDGVEVITDGVVAHEGEAWDSVLAATWTSEDAYVEFDLGDSRAIVAAFLQGDNNDDYEVTISEDDVTFVPLWTAKTSRDPGLRDRWSDKLSGQGRWVRIAAHGGDHAFALSELSLFAERPPRMPPPIPHIDAETRPTRVRTRLLYLILAFGVGLATVRARPTWKILAPAVLIVLAGGWGAFTAIHAAWPLAGREVAFFRAAAAAIALLAVGRSAWSWERWPVDRRAVTLALTVSAVMGFAAFYNLGHPQFYDAAKNRGTYVHVADMRIYQPFAKYFEELGYDGVYLASALAYAEDHEHGSLERIRTRSIRDLRNHETRTVGELETEIRGVRKRFTDARWADLRADIRYYADTMGDAFLATLDDHGANATPVWVFFARLLVGHAPASEALLTATGFVDGALLLALAVVMWRAFGLWPALLAMTVFGATDLYMYGTDWGGATLRHDWLVLLGFGVCALKKERWVAAGVCLAVASMIRAFPVVGLVGVALPMTVDVGERWVRERRMPRVAGVWEAHRGAVLVLASAGATAVFMFLLTGALYSFHAWADWSHKVGMLNAEVLVNDISLRALVAGGVDHASSVVAARYGIYLVARLGGLGLIALLARRRPLDQAMLIALPLVWLFFNPLSYYSHFVCLFALLAATDDRASLEAAGRTRPLSVPFARVAVPLLALCVGGYWASLDPDYDRHFQDETLLILVTAVWLHAEMHRVARTAACQEPATG